MSLFQQFSWKRQIYDEKTAKDGTPILLKTCCFNDIEKQILDLPEACRCRTTQRNADSSAGYLSL